MTDFNDKPIENTDQDLYGMAPFAEKLAKGILNVKNPMGTTIALSGEWGSGKSSTINLVKSYLGNQTGNDTQNGKNDSPVMISEFKCWWFRGEEALALAFLKELIAFLGYDDEIRRKIVEIAVEMLQRSEPVVGYVLSVSTSGVVNSSLWKRVIQLVKILFSKKKETLEELFKELNEKLSSENRRFLIIIDDMDRLAPDEMLAMFRLIKTIGRLPNVLYLLAFDRKMAEKVVSDKFPAEGVQYLEKIIQVNFDLPTPSKAQLIKATQKNIKEICGLPHKDDLDYYRVVVNRITSIYITTPRHVVRLQNAIRLTWPMIANEINIADFITLEIIRLYESKLFIAIKENAYFLNQNIINKEIFFNLILEEIPDVRQHKLKIILEKIFPVTFNKLIDSAYECVRKKVSIYYNLVTYLKLQPQYNIFSKNNIRNFLRETDNSQFIKAEFIKAIANDQQKGTRQVTECFYALMMCSSNSSKENIESIIETLLELYEIFGKNLYSENIYFQIRENLFDIYIRLISNLTSNFFSQKDREDLLLDNITSTAGLGWYISFINYLYDQFVAYRIKILNEKDLKQLNILEESNVMEGIRKTIASEEFQRIIALNCSTESFVREDSILAFVERALEKINEAKDQGTLLNQYNLLDILLFWRKFKDNDDSEVKNWTDSFLDDPQKLLTLAKAMQFYYIGATGEMTPIIASKTLQSQVVTSKFYDALKKILDSVQLKDEKDLINNILKSKDSSSG